MECSGYKKQIKVETRKGVIMEECKEKINGHRVKYYSFIDCQRNNKRTWFAFIHTKGRRDCLYVHWENSFSAIVRAVHERIHQYEVDCIVKKTH